MTQAELAMTVIGKREGMIKLPSRATVHLTDDNLVVVTFSEGENKESFSFALSNQMARDMADGLSRALTMGKQPDTMQ